MRIGKDAVWYCLEPIYDGTNSEAGQDSAAIATMNTPTEVKAALPEKGIAAYFGLLSVWGAWPLIRGGA